MTRSPVRAGTVLIAGLLLVLRPAAAQNTPATAPPAPAPPNPKILIAEMSGIITQGVGVVKLKPELALVTLTARAQAPTLLQATNESRALAGRIVEAVRRTGVAAADITVNPEGGSGFGGGGFGGGGGGFSGGLGGGVSEQKAAAQTVFVGGTLLVTVRDVGSLGKVLAAAAGGGATGQAFFQYAVKEEKTSRNAALKAAVVDALGKAQAMAEAANVGSLTLAALTEGFIQPPFAPGGSVDLAQFTATTFAPPPVQMLVARASVTARFTLAGPRRPTPRVGGGFGR